MESVLRKKFVFISMSVFFVVLVTLAAIINVTNYMQIDDQAVSIVEILSENDGKFPLVMEKMPQHFTAETPYSTRYFTVKTNAQGELTSVDTRSVQVVSTEQAIAYANEILESGDADGFAGSYKYHVEQTDYGQLLIFVDCTEDLLMFRSTLTTSLWMVAVILLAVFLLLVTMSKHAVAPIVESYRKQQQFITNISHELKTPLAIIQTSTDVIEMEYGSSQWSENVHTQIGRLNGLVNYLVSLSKMDEDGVKMLKVDFSLSDAVTESVDGFALMAQVQERTLETKIAPHISYSGDEQSLRLLLSILLDNALKYGDAQAPITVRLERVKNKIVLTVRNTAGNLQVGNYDMLFERFYRIEGSRNSETGGFGIGLAIAKTIVRKHAGEIHARCDDGKTLCIQIEL